MSGTNGTTGFFTPGEFGNSALEAEGNEAIPSTFGQAAGAQFGQAFAENPGSRLARRVWRNLDSTVTELQPDELNSRFSVPGKLTFDAPTTEAVARDMYEHHRAQVLREDAIRRRGDSIGGGMGTSILTGLAAGLLDPLNIAASFIPVVGEANLARLFGQAAAGAGGRALVRGAQGAIGGFVGGLAVEPLNAYLTVQDRDDYDMSTFLTNVAVGTVLGGAIQTGVGAIRDRRGVLPPWSPEMHDAARVQAIAAMAEGRPIQAAEAMDFVASREGSTELRRWYDTQSKLASDVDNSFNTVVTREDAVRTARERLDGLSTEAQKVRLELDDLNSRLSGAGIDPSTRDRLDLIETELTGKISRKRRADLEAERSLLTEGANPEADLADARTQAEITGTEAVLRRTEARERLAAANVERAEATLAAADTLLEKQAAAQVARREVVKDMTAKTLRGVAHRLGVAVDPDDLAAAVNRITRAAPDQVDATIQAELRRISDKAVGPFLPQDVVMQPPTRSGLLDATAQRIDASRTRAEDALLDPYREKTGGQPQQDARLNDAASERAPKVDGTLDEQITSIEKANADIESALAAEQKFAEARAKREGREPPARDPALDEADAMVKEGDSLTKAYEAAAACMIGGA